MNGFITGTDTDVGKTYCTALLTRALRHAGFDTVALKPICCGPRDDVEILCKASDNELSIDEVNPIWMKTPAAPLVASRLEHQPMDFKELSTWFRRIKKDRRSVLVEGAGGWLVPIDNRHSIADLAESFGLPVFIVVANRLGCLNHTLLTVENIKSRGLKCAGLILNTLAIDHTVAQKTNKHLLQELCDAPLLFEISPDQKTIELAVA